MTRTRRVVLAPSASEDVVEIVAHLIASAGLDVAIATNERLDAALAPLDEHASRGRLVPELRDRGVTTYRELIVSPYQLIFRVEPREVWVVAVVDHRRDLDLLLSIRTRRD